MFCRDCECYSNLYPIEGIGHCMKINNCVDDPFVFADSDFCSAAELRGVVVENEISVNSQGE